MLYISNNIFVELISSAHPFCLMRELFFFFLEMPFKLYYYFYFFNLNLFILIEG